MKPIIFLYVVFLFNSIELSAQYISVDLVKPTDTLWFGDGNKKAKIFNSVSFQFNEKSKVELSQVSMKVHHLDPFSLPIVTVNEHFVNVGLYMPNIDFSDKLYFYKVSGIDNLVVNSPTGNSAGILSFLIPSKIMKNGLNIIKFSVPDPTLNNFDNFAITDIKIEMRSKSENDSYTVLSNKNVKSNQINQIPLVSSITKKFAVSTDKTRFFYKGFDNPISISRYSRDDKFKISIQGAGATIRKASSGQYIVNATQTGTTIVTLDDGNNTEKFTIPVKRIPDPIILVGGSAGGNMPAASFRAQERLMTDLNDFTFEGIKFNILSYFVIASGRGFDEPDFAEVNGPDFSGGASALIKKCQAGTTVTIADIKVSEPGGGSRKLNQTITFILQ